MSRLLPPDAAWRPISEPPELSGVYAVVDTAVAGLTQYAAFLADRGEWSVPQRDLRLFSCTESSLFPGEGGSRPERWRELTDDELRILSPLAQAWAAAFLPVGAAILPVGESVAASRRARNG